jgi:hypothetical protein
VPQGTINLSDPDSRVVRTQGTPPRRAYNAQTTVNDRQIILAAQVTVDAPDFGHLEPMLDTTLAQLDRQGITEQPRVLLADAGYWHTTEIQTIADLGIEVLAPPDGNMRQGTRPGWDGGLYQQMRESSPPTGVVSFTDNERSLSNPSKGRSNTTATSTGSCEEAEPPPSQSGG